MFIISFVCAAKFFRLSSSAILVSHFISITPLSAATYPMPPAGVDLIGDTTVVSARAEDTLLDIARQHDIGQDEILLANPEVDRWLPGEGTKVTLPARSILPHTERKGVVLNLPEMRLYYYYTEGRTNTALIKSYPASIGRMDWNTPLGKAKIAQKDRDPYWRPPKSLKEEAKAEGDSLPDVVPPGPDNPLGRYALRLSIPGYLIHSTNKPYGVGMRVTHGCVRMYPEDMEEFFPLVPLHTAVNIVNQPIKLGWEKSTLFMEVHPFMDEDKKNHQQLRHNAYEMILEEIKKKSARLDLAVIRHALEQKNGIPVAITLDTRDKPL